MRSVKGFVSGRVQGVGFRYFVYRHAELEGLTGYARNLSDGRVEFLLQGEEAAIERVVAQIRQGPRHSQVAEVYCEPPVDLHPRDGFVTG